MKLFKSKKEKITGYVYSALKEDDRFKNAKIDDIIKNQSKKPPYIVVDHSFHTTLITKWPGRLFKVEVLNQNREKSINRVLARDIWYTRTFGVKIIDELPVDILFGGNGKFICELIDFSQRIEEKEVVLLSGYDGKRAREIFSNTWKKWIQLTDDNYPLLDEDYSNIIKASPKNQKHNSPIREGLSVISSQFDIRAREVLGELAFQLDEEGEYELIPLWASAVEKILHAAMSHESDNLLTIEEKEVLRKPVQDVLKKQR